MSEQLPDLAIKGRGSTLGDQVYERLREALLWGTLAPGQRLNTRALAASLNVSLTPTREGLGRLIAEGALHLGANRVVSVPVLASHEILEVFNLRALLEAALAVAAAPKVTEREIGFLDIIQSEIYNSIDRGDYKDVMRLNFRFHFGIYGAAGMPLALHIVENLWLRAGPVLNFIYPRIHQNQKRFSQHSAILEALKSRDIESLKAALSDDILGARDVILKVNAESDSAPDIKSPPAIEPVAK